jgi:hypothetical protein
MAARSARVPSGDSLRSRYRNRNQKCMESGPAPPQHPWTRASHGVGVQTAAVSLSELSCSRGKSWPVTWSVRDLFVCPNANRYQKRPVTPVSNSLFHPSNWHAERCSRGPRQLGPTWSYSKKGSAKTWPEKAVISFSSHALPLARCRHSRLRLRQARRAGQHSRRRAAGRPVLVRRTEWRLFHRR